MQAQSGKEFKLNRAIVLLIAGLVVLATLACNAATEFLALTSPTETPTRTPRPTFTPRPVFTPTPEDTPTPETTEAPAASPTPTKRPVVTARPATAKPVVPTAPPAPQFAWKQSSSADQGRCDAGPSVYEIAGRVHDGKAYVGGIHVVLIDKNGKVIAQTDSLYPINLNPESFVSCFAKQNINSYKLDASPGWFNGPLTLRLTRSATDLTPISTDVKINFDSSGGRYYIDWTQ